MVNSRKAILKELRRHVNDLGLKKQLNFLTKLIKTEIKAFQECLWDKFCLSLNNSCKNSTEYWNKIKAIGSLEYKPRGIKKIRIPDLVLNGQKATNSVEKAEMFGSCLEKIFSDEESPEFDVINKENIETYLHHQNSLFTTMPGEKFFDNDLTMAELENSLKGINLKSAPGNDGIRYLHLKNLSQKGKLHCLRIFNKSWKSGKLIADWKIGEVTMIGKDKNNLNDPVNYRPISLTKCMGKIMEKIVNNRLVYFLNKHDVISNFQSGFRSKRQPTDNLLFLSQKAFEAYGCKKMMCGVVMDIQKAFDKVWHKGLIYKMSKLNLPVRMGKWIKDSVEGSQFYVKVGKEKSDLYNVTAGVFQGRILSPLLFSIYINDIELINKTPTNKVDTLMFADDIFSLTADHNIRRLFILMQQYLDKTEKWFKLWRMKLSAHKCYYSIFTKGNVSRRIKDNKLKLYICGAEIKPNDNIKYLGITLDRKLNLVKHTKNMLDKCQVGLNVLRNLANKRWALNNESLLRVYKCLVRSKMEYAAPTLITSQYYIQAMQSIQYKALRIILKKKPRFSSTEMHTEANILTMGQRFAELSVNYLKMAEKNNNPLVKLLSDGMSGQGNELTPLVKIRNLKTFDKTK